jgi:hypothetical protein
MADEFDKLFVLHYLLLVDRPKFVFNVFNLRGKMADAVETCAYTNIPAHRKSLNWKPF